MPFSPQIAEQRFGYGLSPRYRGPGSVKEMLVGLRQPDHMQAELPVPGYADLAQKQVLFLRFHKHATAQGETPAGKASAQKRNVVRDEMRDAHARTLMTILARRVHTRQGFRERLVAFWADHFSVAGKAQLLRFGAPRFAEDVVRPHVAGRFADMLLACVRHPLMLHYLDQEFARGPNSTLARKRGKNLPLNENLAREVLELHTLGVGAGYDQADISGLAALLTGLSRGRDYLFRFRKPLAEPGEHTVLGKRYPAEISMARIEAVLRDLAAHPATAAHIARKLCVHFVADHPPADLIEAVRQAYLESDGDLVAVYAALLNHPKAWQLPATNIRPPEEFISAALRALSPSTATLAGLELEKVRSLFIWRLSRMEQDWSLPGGPDGWPEDDVAWITPQGIAGRVEWAMLAPERFMDRLPDPREFVHHALGPDAPEKVVFAAGAAESRPEGVGFVLMSSAFQRR